uniref:Uncharacterized protein n=1 Tax=Arundo donax TaxID=35708 RepID=A0A0A9HH55_ARUDO
MEQNERLKKSAQLLQNERQRLLSQLQAQVLSVSDDNSSPNNLNRQQQQAAAAQDGNKVTAESSSPEASK